MRSAPALLMYSRHAVRRLRFGVRSPATVAGEHADDHQGRLFVKIVVPKESKRRILHELNGLGIHEGNLFPDMDREARYLTDVWINDAAAWAIADAYRKNHGVG